MDKVKQVIVVSRSLNMSHGKMAAQVAHASLNAYLKIVFTHVDEVNRWWDEGITKIVLATPNEDTLLALHYDLVHAGLSVAIIKDEGLTEVVPGSYTALAVGPILSSHIDPFTGTFPLY